MYKKARHLLMSNTRLPGFTLVELAVVLIILGVLLGGIFKGRELMTSAKLQNIIKQVNHIQTAVLSYQSSYQYWPGDDPLADQRFDGNPPNGQGTGRIDSGGVEAVWIHLAKADLFPSDKAPTSKLGGVYTVVYREGRNWLMLTQRAASSMGLEEENRHGVLTPQQIQTLKSKAGESEIKYGMIRAENGTGTEENCLNSDGTLNLKNKKPVCILKIALG